MGYGETRSRRATYGIVVLVAAIALLGFFSTLSGALQLPSNTSNLVIFHMTLFNGDFNATIYISNRLPYNSSIDALVPRDEPRCIGWSWPEEGAVLRVRGLVLYIDPNVTGNSGIDLGGIVFYDVNTGLPVLKLIPCGTLGQEPLPMVLVYYKTSVERILGDRDSATLRLRIGKVIVANYYSSGSSSVKPDRVVPEVIGVTIYRIGEEALSTTPTITMTTTTITKTVTLPPETVTFTTTLTKAVTLTTPSSGSCQAAPLTLTTTATSTTTKTIYTILYTTVYKTLRASATTVTETKVLEKPVTITKATTVTTTVTETQRGASVVTSTILRSESTRPYLAASILALLVSIAAFAIAVRR